MDHRRLDEIIKKRERNYIWLEKELKKSIFIIVSVLLALFLIVTLLWKLEWLTIGNMVLLYLGSVLLTSTLAYRWYRRLFFNFEQILTHLEAYENGNYLFHTEECHMKEGIQPQIIEQLGRMGMALEVMKNRMMDEKENTKALITDISHQLKTPLSALKLIYELSREEQINEAEKSELWERGEREILKLQYLMDSMTNLSRMEAGIIQIDSKEGDVMQTLTRAVSSVYMKAYQKHIEIELYEQAESLSESDRQILHDGKWTEEVFVNLLDNAIKYSKEYTTIHIGILPNVSYIVITIQDEGIGIPKEEYTSIFHRFYRGDVARHMQPEGAGVGLYLARRIIESQGGNIRVKSEPDKGSLFQVMLPKKAYTL